MLRSIIRILSCFIIDKEKRRNFRNKFENKILVNQIFADFKPKYKNIIFKLREYAKTRKLKVCFLVSETTKWNLQSVYDDMENSTVFEPVIVVTTRLKYYTPNYYNHCYDFFKMRCKNVVFGFDPKTEKSVDIKIFKPDIVFYQQPWDIFENQGIDYVSDFALTCYCPYPIAEAPETIVVNLKNFHYKLWKHFLAHSLIEKQYDRVFGYAKHNIVVSGHPKLDVYKNFSCNEDAPYVIYAPHHALSFSWIKYSTFDWNGKYMLDWAKAHPEIKWIFKPHPDLKRAVWFNEKLMNEEEIENYYEEWKKISLYYDDGDYFDLFKKSRCLITDCGSFLTEYLPTQKPVIHLRSKSATGYMDLNNEIMKHYYQAWNLDDLAFLLEDIIIKNNDPMKNERLKIIKQLGLNSFKSSDFIIEHLKKELKI